MPEQVSISVVSSGVNIAAGAVTSVTAGTGLTGGNITSSGTIAADFAASGSDTANKVVEATDSRLSNARTPTTHGSSHGVSGSDAIPADGLAQSQVASLTTDLAAKVPSTRQVIAGTGLGGGGALSADVTLSVSYGTSSTTACVGNDARLTNSRTPEAHASTHSAAGSDPLTLSQSQITGLTAALSARALTATQVIAGTGLTGGGDLTTDRTLAVAYGTTSTTATVGDDGRFSFISAGSGATTRTLQNKLRDVLSVKDFGAIGDGTLYPVSDWYNPASPRYRGFANLAAVQAVYPFVTGATYSIDLAAINAALLYLSGSRISPPTLAGYGLGKILVPRGKYMINGEISVASPLGVKFVGEGMFESVFVYTLSSGNMVNVTTHIAFQFEDMGFFNDTSDPRASWTSVGFNLNPTGGGKLFTMINCYTSKFNIVVNVAGAVNNDEFTFQRVFVADPKTFLYARNSQAVINTITSCTFFGTIDRVFDVSGFGYTTWTSCNIVQSGTFLYLANGNSGNSSQYSLSNCKFEFWPQPTNGTSKIIESESNASNTSYVKMQNCGISGGAPDASIYQFDINSARITLDVDGGEWGDTKISTKAFTDLNAANVSWIKFTGCVTSPSTTVNRVSGADGFSCHYPVIFDTCSGVCNISLRGPATANNQASSSTKYDRNQNTLNSSGSLIVGSTTTTHSFPVYGQRVLIEKIRVVMTTNSSITGGTIKAYKDAAKTSQIGSTITLTGTAPLTFDVTVAANTFTTEGVYVQIENSNVSGFAAGSIYVDTLSV